MSYLNVFDEFQFDFGEKWTNKYGHNEARELRNLKQRLKVYIYVCVYVRMCVCLSLFMCVCVCVFCICSFLFVSLFVLFVCLFSFCSHNIYTHHTYIYHTHTSRTHTHHTHISHMIWYTDTSRNRKVYCGWEVEWVRSCSAIHHQRPSNTTIQCCQCVTVLVA